MQLRYKMTEYEDVIRIDFKNRRLDRQKINNSLVYTSIKNNNRDSFFNNINIKEWKRILEDLKIDIDTFFTKCKKDDLFCKLASRNLSKLSSRQGCKDENEQLKVCIIAGLSNNIQIKNISTRGVKPSKNGKIFNNTYVKKNKIKTIDCLKSFDGEISGKVKGYISCKICYDNGGHQDNVFEELYNIGEWWRKFKNNSKEIMVLCIDTDLENKLQSLIDEFKESNNVYIFNHIKFQEFILNY